MSQPTTNTTVSSNQLREFKLFSNGQEASEAEYDRVVNAKPKPTRKSAKCREIPPFSILR